MFIQLSEQEDRVLGRKAFVVVTFVVSHIVFASIIVGQWSTGLNLGLWALTVMALGGFAVALSKWKFRGDWTTLSTGLLLSHLAVGFIFLRGLGGDTVVMLVWTLPGAVGLNIWAKELTSSGVLRPRR